MIAAPSTPRPAHENPFRVERIHALGYRPEGIGWDELLARLAAQRWRGAVVGPHGAGKTTFLAALATRMPAPLVARLLFTNRDGRGRLPADWDLGRDPHAVLLVDGHDLLGARARRRLHRAAEGMAGLVVTSHRRRPRHLPVLHACAPTPDTVAWIAEALAPGSIDRAEAAGLLAAHDGNVRAALRTLYDRCADGMPCGAAVGDA